MMKKQERRNYGFTLVELLVIIAILGILAAITTIGYSNWKIKTVELSVKSDLSNVKAAMESKKNFDNEYPASIPGEIGTSEGVVLTYVSGDATGYCIDASSEDAPTVQYYLDSENGELQSGQCPTSEFALEKVDASYSSWTGDQFSMGWDDIAGAASYEVNWREDGGDWNVVERAYSSYSKQPLTADVVYDFRFRGVNETGVSDWSAIVTAAPFTGVTSTGACGDNQSIGSLYWTTSPVSEIPSFTVFDGDGNDFDVTNTRTTTGRMFWDLPGQDYMPYQVISNRVDGKSSVATTINVTGPVYDCY